MAIQNFNSLGGYSIGESQTPVITAEGNINAANISATGNITSGYFIGNGSQLTGLPTGYSNSDVSAYMETYLPAYTGNISAGYYTGNGSQLTGMYGNSDVALYLPGYTGNIGATLTDGYQPHITHVGTLGSLAVANSVSINGALDVVGNTTLGNLYVSGNINVPGNIIVIEGNAAQFYGDAYGFGALWAGLAFGYANLDFTVAEFSANYDDYAQINFQNINAGANATTDYIATADNGTNSTFYVDLGIASSTFDGTSANNIGNVIGPNDSYLYAMGAGNVSIPGGNLIIAAPSAERDIIFAAGGGSTGDVVMTVSAGMVAVTGNISASYVSSAGNIFASGNIDAENIVGTRVVSRITNVTVSGDGFAITPNANTTDQVNASFITNGCTFNAPSGTPTDGQKLTIRLGGASVPCNLSWNAAYRVIGVTLPTSLPASKYIYVGAIYNALDSVWDTVSVATQA